MRFGDVKTKVPQRRVTVGLSTDLSDLGQVYGNFLVAPPWQMHDKPTDGWLLCAASSDQGFSIRGAQPGWCWGWKNSVFNSRRYSWAPSRAGPAQWMICTMASSLRWARERGQSPRVGKAASLDTLLQSLSRWGCSEEGAGLKKWGGHIERKSIEPGEKGRGKETSYRTCFVRYWESKVGTYGGLR